MMGSLPQAFQDAADISSISRRNKIKGVLHGQKAEGEKI
jgi:hypothetical protein